MAVIKDLTLDFVFDRNERVAKFQDYYGEGCEVIYYFGDSMRIRFNNGKMVETTWVVKPIIRKGNTLIITTRNSEYVFKMNG